MESALADITPEEYQYIVGNLGQSLESGAIEQDDFGRTLAEIAAVVLLILFLRGAGKTAIKLSAEERRLIDENAQLARDSATQWAEEIAAGRYSASPDNPKPASLLERAILWGAAALGMGTAGQLWQAGDPYWQWQVGPTEHCTDCQRLNGQVHRASEWRASGWQPQSAGLECKGFRCQCSLVAADGPGRGGF